MADYDFYVNTYLGSQIPEAMFPGLAEKAAATLEQYDRKYQVTGGEVSRNMAICAMAESFLDHARRCRHAAASVGGVSVRYEAPKETLEQQLYRKASVYLDIYRGVK